MTKAIIGKPSGKRRLYIDTDGTDTLKELREAQKLNKEFYVTNNKEMIEDRKELEQAFSIKIYTSKEIIAIRSIYK